MKKNVLQADNRRGLPRTGLWISGRNKITVVTVVDSTRRRSLTEGKRTLPKAAADSTADGRRRQALPQPGQQILPG